MAKIIICLFLVFFCGSSKALASDEFDYRSLMIEMTKSLVQSQSLSEKDALSSIAFFDQLSLDDQSLSLRVGQDALYFENMETNTIQRPAEAVLFFKKLAAHYQ